MAISFVAAGSVAVGETPTVSYPAGDQEGDLLVLVTTGTATPNTPSGWTQRYAQGAGRFITILTRYVQGGEPNSVVVGGALSRSVMLCYRGAGSYNVVGTVATGTSTSPATTSQTTTYNNDYILSIYAAANGTAATWTAPASTTSRVNSSATIVNNGLLIVDELQAAAGASATRTATLSASIAWAAINISFVPTRTLYWVGGTGTWSATGTGNWANSSGGSGVGILPPVQNETAIIDSSSGTGTITCTAGVCGDLSVTASQAIVLGAAASTLSVYGDLTFPAGGSFSANTNANTITLAAGSAHTVTTNGKSFSSLTFNGVGGNWTLPSALTADATVTLTNGTITLSTNTTTLTCAAFSSTNANTRAIAFGSGNITTTGSGTAFTTATATGLTYTGTPTINISNNSATATTVTAGTTGGASTNALNFNFTTGTYVLTLTTNSQLRNLNFTGFTGSFTQVNLTIFGDFILSSGMTFTGSGSDITFAATSGVQLVSTAGQLLGTIQQSGAGGTVRLAAGTTSFLSNRSWNLNNGTLDLGTNSATLSVGNFNSSGVNARQIQFGTGNITTTGTGTVWNTGTATGFGYTGTPTVNISNNSATATTITPHTTGGTETNSLNFNITTGTYALTISNSAVMRSLNFTGFAGSYSQTAATIFGDLTVSSGMTYTNSAAALTFAATSGVQLITSAGKTLGAITQNGVGGTVRLATSTTLSSRTYAFTNGTLDLATNTATLTCGNFSSDNANTRQIQFGTGEIRPTGWDTNDATNFTYTGTPTVNTFISSLTVNAHVTGATASNVLNFTINNASAGLTLETGSVLRSLTFSGTNVWSPANPSVYTFYGNLTLVSGLTLTLPSSLTFNFIATSGTQTITSAGKTLADITQNGAGGTVSLADALLIRAASTYTLTNGTLNANNQNFTAGRFSSNNSNVRTLTMGSGTWTLSGTGTVWDLGTPTNLTFNKDTANIVLSDTSTTARTFQGGGLTYNNLTIGGATGISTLNLSQTNTFATLGSTKTVEYTINLLNNTTVNTWAASGSANNFLNITGSSGTRTLTVTNPFSVNYANISNNTLSSANGTATNSLLASTATGWTVGAGSTYYSVLSSTTPGASFTVPSSWDNSNNSIHVIGGGGGAASGVTPAAGGTPRAGGGGGGGGGYAKAVNQSYTNGQIIPYSIGVGGQTGLLGTSSAGQSGQTSHWNISAYNTVTLVSSQLSRRTSANTTIVVNKPTTSDGNLMIMIVNSSTTPTWTTPTGWTAGSSNFNGRAVFYRIASASEPSSYTVTQSASATATGTILVYSGAQWGGNGSDTASAATVTPSTVVSSSNSTIIYCGFSTAASISFSTPTGYTSRQADTDAAAPSQTVFDISGISAGAYSAPTSTVTGGNARAFLVAISPSPSTSSVSVTGGSGGTSNIAGSGSSTGGTGGIGQYSQSTAVQNTSSTTITINVPAGTANGDLMVMYATSGAATNNWTTPSGWTLAVAATNLSRAVFYRTASSEPASYTVTQSGSATSSAAILTYQNATIDVIGAFGTGASPSVAPAITTTVTNTVILDYVSSTINGSITYSTPTGYVPLISDSDATAPSYAIFSTARAVAGSTGTVSSTPSSGNPLSVLIAIKFSGATGVFQGGTGGAGSFGTGGANFHGGGGGGGAAGPNGNGGNGGNGFSTTANGTTAGGGGGGNGGGSAGGNGSSGVGGNGGNNFSGSGGGVYTNSSTPGNGTNGGGGAGMDGNNTFAGSGGNGIDIIALAGSGGGAGASATFNSGNVSATAGLYGGGGGGAGTNDDAEGYIGGAGAQGVIVLLWGTQAPSLVSSNYFLLF